MKGLEKSKKNINSDKIESQDVVRNTEKSQEINEAEIASFVHESFKNAGLIVKNFLNTARYIRKEPEATNEEKKKSEKLFKEVNSSFTNFYRKFKKTLAPLSLAFFLFSQDRPISEVQLKASQNLKPKKQHSLYLTREEMPLAVKILDSLMSGDVLDGFLNIYNKFEQFKEKRTDGQMTGEEIEFRERIAENIYPYGYGRGIWGEIAVSIGGNINDLNITSPI